MSDELPTSYVYIPDLAERYIAHHSARLRLAETRDNTDFWGVQIPDPEWSYHFEVNQALAAKCSFLADDLALYAAQKINSRAR